MRCFILAGGHSSRFGRDKAVEPVSGVPLVLGVAAAARPHVDDITVVAEVAGKYAQLGLETIADLTPGQGPLGGLRTALACLNPNEQALILSCDLLGLESDWIGCLVREAQVLPTACCLFDTDPPQPLIGCYPARLLGPVEERLALGQGSMRGLLSTVEKRLLPPPSNWKDLRNVNRITDLPAVDGPAR
jgi:molybdopterin-guanine dinucleotide biosynthesis protein A